MKREEAKILAEDKSRLVIEYITQILSDTEKVNSTMNFDIAKIDNQRMCTLNIYVTAKQFERHLNLGITGDHLQVLYGQLLNDILDTFLTHETIGISNFYTIKSSFDSFSGINAENIIGSKIRINFNMVTPEIISEYNKRYNEFLKSIDDFEQLKLK